MVSKLKIFKHNYQVSNEIDNRLFSMTDEFYFVVYNTFSGNRTTLAIYRKIDGELREVNLILNFQKKKNLGKNIKKAIAELRARPINKLYQEYMNYLRSKSTWNDADIITAAATSKQMKHPHETIEEVLVKRMNDDGYKHNYVKYEKRVCRICLVFGDCVIMREIPICDSCRNKNSFNIKFQLAFDKFDQARATAVGGIPSRNYPWCENCGGAGSYTDHIRNSFGSFCKNPDCRFMIVCNVCKDIFSDDCDSKGHDYDYERRYVTFDPSVEKRVCRNCLVFGDCQTIGKKPICSTCKKIRAEKIDVSTGIAEKNVCNYCKRYVVPSENFVQFVTNHEKMHAKCYTNIFLKPRGIAN